MKEATATSIARAVPGVTPHMRATIITGITLVRASRRLWLDGWRPIVEGIIAVSELAWQREGAPTNLAGEPDWTNRDVYSAFTELVGQLLPELAAFLDERPKGSRWELLSTSRKIGQDRDRFYVWIDTLSGEELEKSGYFRTLWNKYQKKMRKEAADNNNEDEDDDADGGPSDEMAELDRINSELKRDLDEYEEFLRDLLAAVNECRVKLPSDLEERLLRLPFVHDPGEDVE
jgi:hypothetical protein